MLVVAVAVAVAVVVVAEEEEVGRGGSREDKERKGNRRWEKLDVCIGAMMMILGGTVSLLTTPPLQVQVQP